MDGEAIHRLLLSVSRELSHWLVAFMREQSGTDACLLDYGPKRPGSFGAEPQFLGDMDQMSQRISLHLLHYLTPVNFNGLLACAKLRG